MCSHLPDLDELLFFEQCFTMVESCALCGRPKYSNGDYCEICSYTLCGKCRRKLSRGYCSICGELVCDDDSQMVGYARVCKECLSKDFNLLNYDYLKKYLLNVNIRPLGKSVKLEKIIEIGEPDFGDEVYAFVGLDDTDSPFGMCTTYLAAKIIESLWGKVVFTDYPILVRLNPNIPMKTRGNGSVLISFKVDANRFREVMEIIRDKIISYSHTFFNQTNSSLTIHLNESLYVDPIFKKIYWSAVRDIITPKRVLREVKNVKTGYVIIETINGKTRGVVGSTAAIGVELKDYTYELIAYRKKENMGKTRKIDLETVRNMDKQYNEYTFNNIDGNRLLISPTGPDPVLFGIRGDLPDKLLEAVKLLKHEEIDMWIIFRSNQGTAVHIINVDGLEKARPYQTIRTVLKVEKTIREGSKTSIVGVQNNWRGIIHLYKPHGYLRNLVGYLLRGDLIEVVGNVISRGSNTVELNLEELKILNLVPIEIKKSPLCPECGSRMKKKSADEYKCKRCGFRIHYEGKLTILKIRDLPEIGKRYLPPPKAHRHLTLPQKRMRYRSLKIKKEIKNSLIIPFFGKSFQK